ncbi:MAG: hypothetical protein ACREVN_06945 [Gammaproteobacteria bacterium]
MRDVSSPLRVLKSGRPAGAYEIGVVLSGRAHGFTDGGPESPA